MGLYRRKGSENFWLQYYAYGERIQETSGTKSKGEATLLLQRRKLELKNGTWRHPRNRGILFRTVAGEYIKSIDYQKLSEKTRRFYGQRIEVLTAQFGDLPVASMTRQDVSRFAGARSVEVSETTVHHELTTLFTVLRWAARESVISHMPFSTDRLKPQRAEFLTRTLSVEEEKKIFRAAQPYQHAMIIAALDAGMHKKEIFGQDWADVDLDRNLIVMTTSKRGRTGRIIPLTSRFREILENLPREAECVFTYKGECILTDTKKSWYRILKDAGVEPIRFHDLRATYGTRLEELNVPPAVSMALMGHRRRSAHDRYVRPQLPALREAIAELDRWLKENDLLHTYYTKEGENVIKFPANY